VFQPFNCALSDTPRSITRPTIISIGDVTGMERETELSRFLSAVSSWWTDEH
jgi:hypothetical protein